MEIKIIHISDNSYNWDYPLLYDKPDELIENINEKHPDPDLFLINVNYKTQIIARADNAGILFLKYLRLHHFKQHCVLYSFLSREEIMTQDPYNSIIFSEGITFVRMPDNLSKINFELLATKRAPDDLSNFFKAEFRLPDDRHFFANWWGVLQLWKVQQAVESITATKITSGIESSFTTSLREMNSYDGLVARYIRGIHEKDIEKPLRILMAERDEKYKNNTKNLQQIQTEIAELRKQANALENQLNIIDEIIDERRDHFFIKLFERLSILPDFLKEKSTELQGKKDGLKNDIQAEAEHEYLLHLIAKNKEIIQDEIKSKNDLILLNLKTLATSQSFITENYDIEFLRKELAYKQPSILFVDDQAYDGWATVFQKIIYGGECRNFMPLQPNQQDGIEKLVSDITKIISEKKIDLLMLDLRLKGESGTDFKIEEISGIQVLRQLSIIPLSCPVLIISASNKIWSYRETLKFNADAYWIKEGLDDNNSLQTSIENYMRLVDLVYSLCLTKEYKYLYQTALQQIINIRDTTKPFWWETKFWGEKTFSLIKNGQAVSPTKIKLIEKQTIIDNLNEGFELLKTYLVEKTQKHQSISVSINIWSLVIMQYSRVLEIIHAFDSYHIVSMSEKMKAQLPESIYDRYNKLLSIRNKAAHNFSENFDNMKEYIDLLMEYLNLEQTEFESEEEETTIPQRQGLAVTRPVAENNQGRQKKEPEDGREYSSAIQKIDYTYNQVYLENPNLNLEDGRTNIMMDREALDAIGIGTLSKGMTIRYKLTIKKVRTNYFATEPIIIE